MKETKPYWYNNTAYSMEHLSLCAIAPIGQLLSWVGIEIIRQGTVMMTIIIIDKHTYIIFRLNVICGNPIY